MKKECKNLVNLEVVYEDIDLKETYPIYTTYSNIEVINDMDKEYDHLESINYFDGFKLTNYTINDYYCKFTFIDEKRKIEGHVVCMRYDIISSEVNLDYKYIIDNNFIFFEYEDRQAVGIEGIPKTDIRIICDKVMLLIASE